MNNFLNLLRKQANFTYTENGAIALKSTTNNLVDLFGCIGSLRTRPESDIQGLFSSAFAENKLLATKMLFYARNIRGGLGERRTFRCILTYLATLHPEIIIKNLDAIALFGRYDDYYTLIGTPAEEAMWEYLRNQLQEDIENAKQNLPISLLAKWLKSVNASSTKTTKLGKLTAKKLGFNEKTYRKTLSALRHYLTIPEVHMAANEWELIKYDSVPSRAMSIYRTAFYKHDAEGFKTYIEGLNMGTRKVNATTLYPYDIIERLGLCFNYTHTNCFYLNSYDPLLEAQWKSLPNYIETDENILIMADTSGSMFGRPLATSIGLAIYFAERNQGAFKNTFMTFSSRPSLITLKGDTLYDKIACIPSIVEDTNLEAGLDLILSVAQKNNLSQEELPKSLIIISDMEFNQATTTNGNCTFYQSMKKKYKSAGYSIPNIVFWNVNSRHDIFQVTSDYPGVQLASGHSPSVFKNILSHTDLTPYDMMVNTLNDPLYSCITV